MSEIKLNLIDTRQILHGTIHAATADRVIAALSAEPETTSELALAATRYEKRNNDCDLFQCFIKDSQPDIQPWDAGLIIIDLPARLLFIESTYSCARHTGQVQYHDGREATDLLVPYRIPDDWKFVDSVEEYQHLRGQRAAERIRATPIDMRRILYGKPLLEHIAVETINAFPVIAQCLRDELPNGGLTNEGTAQAASQAESEGSNQSDGVNRQTVYNLISGTHAKWLATPREDLNKQSPREVILARQGFIDFELHTREMQWSFQLVGPPCLPTDSHAYRFAGFGTHEWVVYYDLVRQLICAAVDIVNPYSDNLCACASQVDTTIQPELAPVATADITVEQLITKLDQIKNIWLDSPNQEYSGRVPANLIENERKRLPIALSGRDMIVDDDCPICRMMARDMEISGDVGFYHLDGAHMDPDFVFSSFLTIEEWEADRLRWKEFHEEFDREWDEAEKAKRSRVEAGQTEGQAAAADWNSKELSKEGVEICTAEPC